MKRLIAALLILGLCCGLVPALGEGVPSYTLTQAFVSKVAQVGGYYTYMGHPYPNEEMLSMRYGDETVLIIFPEDSQHVWLRCYNVAEYTDGQLPLVLEAFDRIHDEYKYVTFHTSRENHSVMGSMDLLFAGADPATAAEIAFSCVEVMVRVVRAAKPILAEALSGVPAEAAEEVPEAGAEGAADAVPAETVWDPGALIPEGGKNGR